MTARFPVPVSTMPCLRLSVLSIAALAVLNALPSMAQAQTQAAELDAVVITGSTREQKLADAPYAISSVSSDALRSAGPMVNLSEALQSVPGLVVANRNNYAQDLQISSRGFGARAGFGVRGMRLYADGIPATMPDGQGQVAHFDLAGADRVEVLRGPFSALYGNSSGGVIALYSKPVTRRSGEVSLDFGSFGLRQQRVAVESPFDGGLSIAASFANVDIDGVRPQSAADRQLANVRFNWLSEADKVTVSLSDQHQRANDPLGLTRQLFDADPYQTAPQATLNNTRKTVDQTQIGVSWLHRIGGDGPVRSTHVSAYTGQRAVVQFLSTPPANQTPATSPGGVVDFSRRYDGIDGRLQWALGDADLITGVNFERQRDDRKGYLSFTGPAATPTARGVVGDLKRDELNKATTREAYAQFELPLSDRWQLSAGMRTGSVTLRNDDSFIRLPNNPDDSGTLKFDYTSPVLGLRFKPSTELTLHASASRGYESPTLGEVAYQANSATGFNTALKAQTSRQLEVGAKWRFSTVGLDVTAFQIDTDREIGVLSNTGGRSVFQNVGKTQRRGAELAGQWRINSGLRAQVALSVLEAEYASGANDGNQIAGTQPASAYAELAWSPWSDGEWGAEWRGQGRTALNDANLDANASTYPAPGFAPGWGIANLRYRHRWAVSSAAQVELLGRFDNITDRRYAGSVIVAEGNGRYYEAAPGRNYLLSLRYRRDL